MKVTPLYNYVERLSEVLRVGSRQAGAEYGLQPVQLEALHYLSICNRYSDTPMAVTEFLGQTKGTVSQTLKVLEKKGFLFREADEDDKRVSHLKVAEAGWQLLARSIPGLLFDKACERLTQAEQSQIVAALDMLLRALLQGNQMKSFGVCATCRYNQKQDEGGYFCDLLQQPLAVDEVSKICKEHKEVLKSI
ncbi:MAG: MarR family winged helix-turn-helix transcriptional regulator [Gammaproteobacteria bacterium]